MCQGGDFTRRNGAGGESIYGATFADESFARKHDTHGLMSMANRGPNTQSSQFFITTRPTPHLDGKHVVFGRVVSGFNIVETMENEPVDSNDRPLHNVMIANCGELVLQLPPGVKCKFVIDYDFVHLIKLLCIQKKVKQQQQQQQEKASESESDVDSASDSEQEEKKKKRKRKRSVDFSDDEDDVSDKQKREEESDHGKKERKHKKHHKSSSKKHRKHKKHHKKSKSSSDDEITKKEEIKEEKKQEQSRYQEYKDRVSEKPEWEQRRRFDDDPNVKFKGRGHVVSISLYVFPLFLLIKNLFSIEISCRR